MDSIDKFYADIQKTKKHYRAEHSSYNGIDCSKEIVSLFEKENPSIQSLASSFANYWFETYIQDSAAVSEEPTEEHIAKLVAMQSLLEDDLSGTDSLSSSDWKELCTLVNYEAEDLDIDLLNRLMAVFLDKQAF